MSPHSRRWHAKSSPISACDFETRQDWQLSAAKFLDDTRWAILLELCSPPSAMMGPLRRDVNSSRA